MEKTSLFRWDYGRASKRMNTGPKRQESFTAL
jgi:hypothetical protein